LLLRKSKSRDGLCLATLATLARAVFVFLVFCILRNLLCIKCRSKNKNICIFVVFCFSKCWLGGMVGWWDGGMVGGWLWLGFSPPTHHPTNTEKTSRLRANQTLYYSIITMTMAPRFAFCYCLYSYFCGCTFARAHLRRVLVAILCILTFAIEKQNFKNNHWQTGVRY
jgi:hypothetical protein